MKLICFPYAGGSATVYSKWNKFIDNSIEIVPFELPGRGRRWNEDLCENMNQLIEDAYEHLKEVFEQDDYMLYGHSMGSWIVYYLALKIEKKRIRFPRALYLSGKEAPHIRKAHDVSFLTDDNEFMNRIFVLGGTPKKIMENQKLMNYYIPIIKNDLRLITSCRIENSIHKFRCDITVFNGINDSLTSEDLIEWRKYTYQDFNLYQFSGGHFFINNHAESILNIIKSHTLHNKL